MESRRWHYYIMFNCILIQYLEGKTFSLNEVIAAESQQKEAFETTLPPKLAASSAKRNSLIKRQSSTSRVRKFLGSSFILDNITPESKKISPLIYKRTFVIKSPLRPKKLKLLQKSRFKRKNLSAKHEINGNEKLKQNYIPLLKSLSMLFDNLLSSDASESNEVKTKKFKRNRYYSEDSFEVPFNCTHESYSGNTKSNSQEKTITPTPTLSAQNSFTTETPTSAKTTSAAAYLTTTGDFSAFRQYKNIPVLLPRNTISYRRNDNGIGEGSGATFHGNIKGNITRHRGDHEHTTGYRENESYAEDDETNTDGVTRNGTRSFRFTGPRGYRNNTGIYSKRNTTVDNNNSKDEAIDDNIRENQFETRGNETKSSRLLQESLRRLRGFSSGDVNQNTEFVQQPKDVRKESVINITYDNTGNKRVTDGGGSIATENQKVRKRNETMIIIGDSSNSGSKHSKIPRKKSPVVMIFDGYSVTRDKNGENKFSEKSVRIRSS